MRPKGPPSDAKIAQYVRDALAFHPWVDRYEITVTVRNKKVYLSGIVDTAFDKKRAENVASNIIGVVAVENRLSINNSWPFKDDHEIKKNIEKEYFWSIYVDGEDIAIAV